MKKGYAIAILCLLLAIGGLGVGIYFDLFHETSPDNGVDTTPFQQVMQEIEDSKDVGNHIWILPDPDGTPTLFRYDKPLVFTAEILKENKAALLHTTIKTDYVTHVGYYELYYEDGWQMELTDGKPVMYVEKSTYHYENIKTYHVAFAPADGSDLTLAQCMDLQTAVDNHLQHITGYTADIVETKDQQIIYRFVLSDQTQHIEDVIAAIPLPSGFQAEGITPIIDQ